MSERWLPVVGYEGFYEVSDLGRVRSVARVVPFGIRSRWAPSTLRKTFTTTKGYVGVGLYARGVGRARYVHRLVLEAFAGLPPGREGNHRNGVKTDNRLKNLEAVTTAENIAHAIATGLRRTHGERHGNARLSLAAVSEIRRRLAGGCTKTSIARTLGVSRQCVHDVSIGRTWRR